MKVTFIPIVIGVFGTVIEGLLKALGDMETNEQGETIQPLHYWDRPKNINNSECMLQPSAERV